MTLDEAIKHCEEVAEQNETSAITYKNCKEIKTNMYEKLFAEKAENDCRECAAEHRQLAEWLRELKDLREENKVLTSENYKLTQELEQLGTDFNNQVSLVGWHEEQEEEYKRLLGKAMKVLNDGSCSKDCRQCKWNNNGCEMSCRFAWKYGDEVSALIGETNDEP